MATPPDADEESGIANHTLASLRSLDRKLDIVVDVSQRHGERLARLEHDLGETRRDLGETRRDLGEIRRDLVEVKGDIALLENKVLTAQTEILTILSRLDRGSDRAPAEE
jgi:hypothetical protein